MQMSIREDQIKALANETRLEILRLLDDPLCHFAQQESADPVETGVCIQLIAEHFGVSQPTMSRHIELLKRAALSRQTGSKSGRIARGMKKCLQIMRVG